MELLSIVLSIPLAFVSSMLYCLFLARVLLRFERVSRWLRIVSRIVMASFAAEIILLVTLGPVRSRGLLGPGFYIAHVILFFLSTPALANLLVLRPRPGAVGTWYVAGTICTAFAFFLVLLQYTVSESLFGIDGENGPYSQVVTRPTTCAAGSSKPLP
jgi:hypothetical protein